MLGEPQKTELLFNCIQPLIRLQRSFCFLKNRRLSVEKVLESAELVRFRSLMLVSSMSLANILCETTCRRNMVGSLPRGMPKVVDCRQTDAQATKQDGDARHTRFYPGSATEKA